MIGRGIVSTFSLSFYFKLYKFKFKTDKLALVNCNIE